MEQPARVAEAAPGPLRDVQAFGSTQRREGWARNVKAPYNDSSSAKGPGPGSYPVHKTQSSFVNKPRKTLSEEPVAFGATVERPCMQGPEADAARAELPVRLASAHARVGGRGCRTHTSDSPPHASPSSASPREQGPGMYTADQLSLYGSLSRRMASRRPVGAFGSVAGPQQPAT